MNRILFVLFGTVFALILIVHGNALAMTSTQHDCIKSAITKDVSPMMIVQQIMTMSQ
ncbi:MAG: hypothetical protein M3044_09100 [Thermoproteota archaeon]|nr:hypothetical protein [Thermoproteota archaeon]